VVQKITSRALALGVGALESNVANMGLLLGARIAWCPPPPRRSQDPQADRNPVRDEQNWAIHPFDQLGKWAPPLDIRTRVVFIPHPLQVQLDEAIQPKISELFIETHQAVGMGPSGNRMGNTTPPQAVAYYFFFLLVRGMGPASLEGGSPANPFPHEPYQGACFGGKWPWYLFQIFFPKTRRGSPPIWWQQRAGTDEPALSVRGNRSKVPGTGDLGPLFTPLG